MELRQYPKDKAAGTVELKRYGDQFLFIKRCYSKDDGKECSPETGVFSREQFEKQKKDLEADLAGVTLLLDDMAALK